MSQEEQRPDPFCTDRLNDLAKLMIEHDLSELDLRADDVKISLKRGGQPVVAAPASSSVTQAKPPAEAAAAPVVEGTYIESPMVGTFYAKPNPESPNFVKVGDFVTSETTVCIIEAMKTFNEIPAGVSGRIVEVLIDNESPVDVDRKLFKVDTSATA